MTKVLVTGAAGFIGFHLAKKLLDDNFTVHGLDNLNAYYDPKLKDERLKILQKSENFKFTKADLSDEKAIDALFEQEGFDVVVNLAAQAGVRYSLEHPRQYIKSNIVGFENILEACRHNRIKHLIYASTSSVYGANKSQPFSTDQPVEHPLTLYAATKKSNELMAHSYSHLFDIPTTGLRFFTVYGPWGRPDMALFLFTEAMIKGEPIKVFNKGEMWRDFTYVEDIVESIKRLIPVIPKASPDFDPNNPNPSISTAPYRVFNIGNSTSVKLLDMIEILEKKLGIKAKKNLMDMQLGDVPSTLADVTDLVEAIDFKPQTTLEEGVGAFIDWHQTYYR